MPSPEPPPTVLILEDDLGVARLQRLRLERAGYAVTTAVTTAEALGHLRAGRFDLLVLDQRLNAGENGLSFYAELQAAGLDLPVILVTGYQDDATVVRALRAGVRDYVFKSVEYLDYLPEAARRILDQERTKRQLADSQRRIQALFEGTQDAILFANDAGVLVDANPAAVELTGYSPEELRGMSVADLADPSSRAGAADLWGRFLHDGRQSGDFLVRRKDGTTVPAEYRAVAHVRTGLHLSVLRDVSERRKAEAALRESEQRFRTMADGTPVPIWVTDTAGRLDFVNRAWTEFFGVTLHEVSEDGWVPLVHPEDAPAYVSAYFEAAAARRPFRAETRVRRHDGEWRWVSSDGLPRLSAAGEFLGMAGSSPDTTDQKRALADLQAKSDELKATTQQLWQAARLAGVGELAASIAHELNNPLATVHLRLEGVLAKTPADDPRRRPLEIVDQEVNRMAGLVGNLLHFIRPGRDKVSTVDVPLEVRQTIELTEPHLRRLRVTVHPEFAPDVPLILADRQQLRQVLLNLFTNAGDAMPAGGRLTVRVRPGQLPDGRPAVVIEVADTGTGIPPDVLPRVFDPFFTTKEEGKGTGLGLAICKRIIDHHHGRMEIDSEPGRGTTVRIILPVKNGTNVNGLHEP